MNEKFIEGDKVKIVKRGDKHFPEEFSLGDIGEVIDVETPGEYDITVRSDKDWQPFYEEEIELVNKCPKHGRNLYNENLDEYFCPFCEDD